MLARRSLLFEHFQRTNHETSRIAFSALIGAVASARSMTPMASIAAARLLGYRTPGHLVLLNRPLFTAGALAMGAGELLGDKMNTAPDHGVTRCEKSKPLAQAIRLTIFLIAACALNDWASARFYI